MRLAQARSIRSASVSAPAAMRCPCSALRVAPMSRRPFLRICSRPQPVGGALAVGRQQVRVAVPVEQAGVRDRSAQCIAVAADRLAQRMHDQRCAHGLRLEQVRRGHGAVHHVEQAALRAQRCRCRPGPRPGCADWRWSPRTPCRVCGRRAAATLAASVASTSVDFAAELGQGVHPARGVAEQEAAGHHVVAFLQQRQDSSSRWPPCRWRSTPCPPRPPSG